MIMLVFAAVVALQQQAAGAAAAFSSKPHMLHFMADGQWQPRHLAHCSCSSPHRNLQHSLPASSATVVAANYLDDATQPSWAHPCSHLRVNHPP